MTTTHTNPALTWYRSHGGYVNREGFGFLLCWEGRYVWQAPESTVIEIKAKNCAEAKRIITSIVKSISVHHGSQWRGYCLSCGAALRSWDNAQDMAMAIIRHLRSAPTAHPQFIRYN